MHKPLLAAYISVSLGARGPKGHIKISEALPKPTGVWNKLKYSGNTHFHIDIETIFIIKCLNIVSMD
jgi:hypothetical protein